MKIDFILSFVALLALAAARPIPKEAKLLRREVPQEHSHEQFITTVRASLNLNNPNGFGDPVFALLGNEAAAEGLGQLADVECLQQAIADQAFTNAKAANDVQGMASALIYRALERNTAKVGQVSNTCTSIQAINPEIAVLQQHQDPASQGAAEGNKAIVLELAKQISAIGGDPQEALKSGTFQPGDLADASGKGNTCDDLNDPEGCIFTQNLLVEDATADEITAVVGGATGGGFAAPGIDPAAAAASVSAADTNPAPATSTGSGMAAGGDFAASTVDPAASAASVSAADTNQATATDMGTGMPADTNPATATDMGTGMTVDAAAVGIAVDTAVTVASEMAVDIAPEMAVDMAAEMALDMAAEMRVDMAAGSGNAQGAQQIATQPVANANQQANTGTVQNNTTSTAVQAADVPLAAAGGQNGTAATTQTGAAAAASAGLDFGSCPNAGIVFGPGFDGRKEDSFQPADTTQFTHGSAQNIDIITDFMCDRFGDRCGANEATNAACMAATAATKGKTGQAAATAWNEALGLTNVPNLTGA
ncbi:hypothetical protein EPUS_09318 [Endocarpon pusillum Z07020]|uniref:Cell wall protein n=1 Tax=Endocarpon pusillum (strain Z07020 / HMAS-L-300199) TaxID=1263415 RepID=U1I1L8_ENDPU|nr:uncharacterized protein EPUS_09318 [Endocarpon pusillum Z07020]ERF77145.1 hypothetical protein EPUS_09318 [Endocarpon pusillum Z07020]